MNDAISSGFLLPHSISVERLVELLGGETQCHADESVGFTLKYFDSFDWRLHAAGLRLLHLRAPQGAVLRLKPSEGGAPTDVIEFADEPAWPADLPDGTLKTTVAKLLDMRVLLPLAVVEGEATDLRILNEDAKTVVRLQLLKMSCGSADVDEPRALWPRLRLMPVRGYQRHLDELEARLADEMEWPRAPDCLFDEAMAAVGREAGDYSSKLAVPLKPDQTALDATRKVLKTLLDTLERNVEGTRSDLDSEFLHDLRVATRRTRSVLAQVKRVLPDDVVADYKERFGWLGKITGPTRDLDVFLLELPRYRASLPAAMRDDLDGLEQHLRAAHATEQATLKEELGSAKMRKLLADWHEVLEADQPPGEPGQFADQPIERVAAERIWRMYKKVLKDGRAVKEDGPPEEMHELRKDCKKLRYLIEFFSDLYPPKEMKKLVRALKDLLDNLGEFQDLEVQADKLRSFAQGFDPQDPHSMPTVMAIGALVADLLRHQQAAHGRFAACFAGFDSEDNRERYKRLFKAKDGKEA